MATAGIAETRQPAGGSPPQRSLPATFWWAAGPLAAMTPLGNAGQHAFLMAALWLTAFAAITILTIQGKTWNGARLFWPILALGAILRILFFFQIDISTDIYRYVWEGWLQLQGVNPYVFAPDDPSLLHLLEGPQGAAMSDVWQGINHKDWPAIYPPLAQLLFRGVASLAPTVMAAKALILAFEFVTLACVALLVHRRGMPDAALALYALNPLILFYFAGEGHIDALMTGFLAAAFVCFEREKRSWDRWGFLLLGLAGMAKYFAFALWPFFITRRNWRLGLLSFLPLLCYIPFLDAGWGVFGSLRKFGSQMHYNDALAAVLRVFFGEDGGTMAVMLLLGAALLAIWLAEQNRLRSAFLAALAILICLPTLHPWYLLFGALLLPLFPSRAVWLLMAVQCWTFAVQHAEYYSGVFQEIYWLKALAYVPVAWLLWRAIWKIDSLMPRHTYAAPTSLSIILPVLNEGQRLQPCLEAVKRAAAPLRQNNTAAVEVLVADGGSSDETLDIARQFRTVPIHTQQGRGQQIAAAATVAKGDVLLILHADCLLQPDALDRLLHTCRERREAPAGCLGMRFATRCGGLWLIETLNAVRAYTTSITFGDQGQWIRREALDELGGFSATAEQGWRKGGGIPALWLMEDVELALRAKSLGPYAVPLPWSEGGHYGLVVSPRGWERRGLGKGARSILTLFFRYLLERRLGILQARDPAAAGYYERYYGRSTSLFTTSPENDSEDETPFSTLR